MTVSELIAHLSKFPSDLSVMVVVDSPTIGDSTYAYNVKSCNDNAVDAEYDGIANYVTLTFAGESDMRNA